MIDKFGDIATGAVHSVLRRKLAKGEIHTNPRLNEFLVRGDFDGDGTLDWGDVSDGIGHLVDHADRALEVAGSVLEKGFEIITSIF